MKRALVAVAVMVMTALAAPAAAQVGPSLAISPTSGPIGTSIRAEVGNCAVGEARLDFAFVTGTPANSEFFDPQPDGTATVHIVAEDKEIHSGETAAVVNVFCANGHASTPFTVERTTQAFRDVPANHTHAAGIAWLVEAAITQGCAPDLFCPGASVTRAQMATFLQRALDLPDGSVAQFSDVPANHTHAKGIGAVASAGITSGCASGRYCPNESVSRGQMATFLQRALDLPDGSVAQFNDVPANHTHAKGIGAVAGAGITSGCASDLYCPADDVSRGQMATFLMRALQ